MTIIKPRYEPVELQILKSLKLRMDLPPKDANHYLSLEKGYKGEQKFDEWLVDCPSDRLILNDLLLESNNSVFQIDSALIGQETTYLFEVKNFDGDYYIDGDKWYTLSKTEIKNPIQQLERSESLFRRLLHDLGFNTSVKSFIIYINPDSFLYQTPLKSPIIFPHQLNRFFNNLNKGSSRLTEKHLKFAKQLIDIDSNLDPLFYSRLPEYRYDQLKKGICCSKCFSWNTGFNYYTLICNDCGCKEDIVSAVLRSIGEFKILFNDKKITTNTIYEWCKGVVPRKTIRRVLANHLKHIGNGRSSYYIENH